MKNAEDVILTENLRASDRSQSNTKNNKNKKKKGKKKKNKKNDSDDSDEDKEKVEIGNDQFVINQRYSLIKMLGSGSFGEIHLAYDLVEKKLNAIKFVNKN